MDLTAPSSAAGRAPIAAPDEIDAPAPWDSPELFGPRPSTSDYGYVTDRVRQGCTREELAARVAAERPHVELVWVPEEPRLLPPAEVPWLVDAVRTRTAADLRYNVRNGLASTAIWTALAVLWRVQGQPAPMLVLIVGMMGVAPTLQALWGLRRLRASPDYPREQAGVLRYQVWLGTRRIVLTWVLAACLIAAGVAQLLSGVERSVVRAGLVKPIVRQGHELWRLLTCEFLHGHVLHFAFNFMALLALGRLVEVHGHAIYLPIVFLFSALCASLASMVAMPQTPSVGASGGLMGLIGFLAVLGWRRRSVVPKWFLKSITLSIALTAGAGLAAYGYIDNAAHGGGLIGGLLLGLLYIRRRRDDAALGLAPSRPARIAGALSLVILIVGAAATVWIVLRGGRGA